MIATTKKTKLDTEVWIGNLKVGAFEQMNPSSPAYTFLKSCVDDALTGDHYIAIGRKLNELNELKQEED